MRETIRIKNNLEQLLKARGIYKKDLASAIGVTNATITDFINQNRSTYNITLLENILDYLDIKLHQLLIDICVLELENYKSDTYYKMSFGTDLYLCYSNKGNAAHITVLQVLDASIITYTLNLAIVDFTLDQLNDLLEDKAIGMISLDDSEQDILKKFVALAKGAGKSKIDTYPSPEKIIGKLDTLCKAH